MSGEGCLTILYCDKHAKRATFVHVIELLEDYGIYMDLRRAARYQIDRARAGRSIILRVKQATLNP